MNFKRFKTYYLAKPFMCVTSCLQMIFSKYNIENYEQEELAKYLNFHYSLKNDSKIYHNHIYNKFFTLTDEPTKLGCNVKDLNKQLFFILNLPLVEHFISYSSIDKNQTIKEMYDNLSKENNEYLVFVDYNVIANQNTNEKQLHCMLIDDIDLEKNQISLISTEGVPLSIISINRFFKAIKSIKGIGGGISRIEYLDTN